MSICIKRWTNKVHEILPQKEKTQTVTEID